MDILITNRLTLRRPLEVDADDVALFLNNFNVSRMLARVPFPYDRRDALEFIEKSQIKPTANGEKVKFIFRERLIGAVGLTPQEDEHILGYWLGEPYWGSGLMKEALIAVLDEHFVTHPNSDIRASVFVDNPASLHLQEDIGFEIIGANEQFSPARGKIVKGVTTRLNRVRFRRATDVDHRRDAA